MCIVHTVHSDRVQCTLYTIVCTIHHIHYTSIHYTRAIHGIHLLFLTYQFLGQTLSENLYPLTPPGSGEVAGKGRKPRSEHGNLNNNFYNVIL